MSFMATGLLRLAATGLCLAVASPALFAAAATDAPLPYVAGEKWSIKTQVSIPGMAMPPGMKMPPGRSMPPGMAMPGGMGMPSQALEVCQAKGVTEQQAAEQQKGCTITNKRLVAGKQTAHMACTMDGHSMEGDVEMESLGPDHYRTTMHVKSEQGSMDMVTEGQKIGGACDANEAKRKGQEMVAKGNEIRERGDKMVAQQCHDMAGDMRLEGFLGKDALCKAPADKAYLCQSAQTYENFGTLLTGKRNAANPELDNSFNPYARDAAHRYDDVGAYCGINMESVHQKLCSTAEKDGKLVFLGENCAAQADPLGEKVCASGMEFSPALPVDARYVPFCGAWLNTDAGRKAAATAQAKAAEKEKVKGGNKPKSQGDKAKEALDKAKSKLKSLFHD
jgi:hypothetical protein